MNKMLIFGLFLEIIRVLAILAICRDPKKYLKEKKKKKKLVNIGGPLGNCAYKAFIIQNLDVVALELDMKVQFANF
jgi:hypothetical protein